MTYAFTVDVEAPAAMYDALHTAITGRSAGQVAGLLVHIGRATDTGFQVLEIWRSEADFQHYNDEIVVPAMIQLAGPEAGPPPNQTVTPLDLHGLVLAGGQVVI